MLVNQSATFNYKEKVQKSKLTKMTIKTLLKISQLERQILTVSIRDISVPYSAQNGKFSYTKEPR